MLVLVPLFPDQLMVLPLLLFSDQASEQLFVLNERFPEYWHR